MPDQKAFKSKPSSWHIAVAAEAIAAAQFARCGYDVSVQYGADQPEYDLVIAKGNNLLKVSVKGSQDLGWGLTQGYMREASIQSGKKGDYHGAIAIWLKKHNLRTVFCFVQFGNVPLDQLPRIYLASPSEVAQRLRESSKGRGESVLLEHHKWAMNANGAGTVDAIPDSWKFSKGRVEELIRDSEAGLTVEKASPHPH